MKDKLVARLVAFQVRRPFVALAFVAVVTLFFAYHALRLTLHTEYDALLPQNAPSVIELHRLEKRTRASQTLLVLLEGNDRATLHRVGDAVAAELRGLGPSLVTSAEDGTQRAREFIAPRSALFLSTTDLARIEHQVDERWSYEVQKADGFLLDDDEKPPPLPTADDLRRDAGFVDRFPTGYFENQSGTALVVAAHSPVPAGDWPKIERALDAMHAAVDRAASRDPARASIRITYAGDMPTALAAYDVVLGDLLDVGAVGLALILAVVVLYFLRARAVFVMGVTILVGLVWTFGLTRMTIGHLNLATAFLVSIVGGNGINVSILYQSRFFEERARGCDPAEAIRRSVTATWQPTVIAALAAAASYGSLLSTDFRAFHDFGEIAAMGMLACWVVKTLMVPPMLVLVERVMPDKRAGLPPRRFEMAYGKPFAWLSRRAPAVVLAASVVVAIAGTFAGVRYVVRGPLDYDTTALQTDDSHDADIQHAWRVCNAILGGSQTAMVVATDSESDARAFADILRARWKAAPAGHKPFAAVHVLADFIPEDQSEKVPLARELGARLRRARERGFIDDAKWEQLSAILPPENLRPFDERDLPDAVADPFTEKTGARGTLVLVEPLPDTSNDLRRLSAFADAYRTTKLPNGKVVRGSGSAVIFADMLGAVARDVPRSVVLSLSLTLAVVIVTFRSRGRHLLAVLFAFWTGIAGVALYLYCANIKINFLNFAALPVTFGIGVDYAINVAQRYVSDGRRDIAATLRTSGGAVVLCSLTTLLGYIALVGSHNRAIRSLGTIAAVGEACCLLGAVAVLPALYGTVARFNRSPRETLARPERTSAS